MLEKFSKFFTRFPPNQVCL